MVPKLAVKPLASDNVMPTILATCAAGNFMSRAHATAAAVVPMVPVVCQPVTRDCVGVARLNLPATSAAIMKDASISDGEEPCVSAIAKMAGIRPEIV